MKLKTIASLLLVLCAALMSNQALGATCTLIALSPTIGPAPLSVSFAANPYYSPPADIHRYVHTYTDLIYGGTVAMDISIIDMYSGYSITYPGASAFLNFGTAYGSLDASNPDLGYWEAITNTITTHALAPDTQ